MPLFTVETASTMGKRSAEAKRLAKLRPKTPPKAPELPPTAPLATDSFLSCQLTCVREQIELMNGRILELILDKDDKSQSIDRLASAVSRLRESERILRNQPLPGSYKPVAQRQRKTYQSAPQADIETRQSVEPTTGGVPPQPQ